ncbi:ribosomal protein S17 [candidate division WWE3 bacterium]|jgi:small subunit ribosomal protein S17|uniref:Ribosomal protein S17 n=1 Tax=candidate division WWE3 bacterium TaxID=2053526 RepID=A0A3A4ZI97_UNCKA|nr:MAG: ribosomal protein S17 [candidate division WWE3 bacterium]
MSKRIFEGKIEATGMQKTVVVSVDVPKRHPIYNKPIKQTKRLLAKDNLGCEVGDFVQVEETRPFSKKVSWDVIKKLGASEE